LTPAQVRDRRARIAAVVGGVLFLGVGAIQGPKLLKMLHGKGTPAASTVAAPSSSPGTTASSSSPGASSDLAANGQLTSFSLLAPQDPFRSQLPKARVGPTGSAGQKTTTTPASKQAPAVPATTIPLASTPSLPAAVPAKALGAGVAGAEVRMNGRRQLIEVGGLFPKRQPLFQLISLGHKRMQIGLVTGSFSDGSRTFKLLRGRRITLVDETDGSRYAIRFVRMTFAPLSLFTVTVAPPPASGQAASSSAKIAAPSSSGGQAPTASSTG
jgi:hypothetical protein